MDISSLGAQLESSQVVRPFTAVDFVVRFPWMENQTRLAGQIRWVKPIDDQQGRFRFGLRFFQAFWELDTLARQGKLELVSPSG